MAHINGVRLKKKFGQNFLRDYDVLAKIISAAELTDQDAVLEIGCGDGFLTAALLDCPIKKLWSFEIDPDWAEKTSHKIKDERFTLWLKDILTIDINSLQPNAPWTIVANLPYQITFPILELIKNNRLMFNRGVIMMQEEVAQKLVKKANSGKDYGFISLFYQHYFEWKLLDKVSPDSFVPAPNIFSRLLHFAVKKELLPIANEARFWEFVKLCFKQPRRTLRNNLITSEYRLQNIEVKILDKRAQQLSLEHLLHLWQQITE